MPLQYSPAAGCAEDPQTVGSKEFDVRPLTIVTEVEAIVADATVGNVHLITAACIQ